MLRSKSVSTWLLFVDFLISSRITPF